VFGPSYKFPRLNFEVLAGLCPNDASDYSLIAVKDGVDKKRDEVRNGLTPLQPRATPLGMLNPV
jgi:hypothetical protein